MKAKIFIYSVSTQCFSAIAQMEDGRWGHVVYKRIGNIPYTLEKKLQWKFLDEMKGNPIPEDCVIMPLEHGKPEKYLGRSKNSIQSGMDRDWEYIDERKYYYIDNMTDEIKSIICSPIEAEDKKYFEDSQEGLNAFKEYCMIQVNNAKKELKREEKQMSVVEALMKNLDNSLEKS